MTSTQSQENPLILLDTKLKRTLRNNQRMVNKGVHDLIALLENIHSGGVIRDQLALYPDGQKTLEQILT